jgi:acetylglutamate kinase
MDASDKADVLLEALPYLLAFRGTRTVVKLGGSAMEDPDALRATLQDVIFLATAGLRPVLVHGGGRPIDRAMSAAGLKPVKVQGRRYTDDATLGIVVRVLRDEVNADIVRRLRDLGGRAVGLHSGALEALYGERLALPGGDGRPIDLGRVGRVTRIDRPLIDDLTTAGVVPVIPSLAQDADGGWLNVNADTAAAAVAMNLQAAKLVFLSDIPGVLRDRRDPGSRIGTLDPAGCAALIADGTIDAGMIPKVEAGLESLRAGVGKVHLLDGRLRHALLLEVFTDQGVGTQIVRDAGAAANPVAPASPCR